MLGFFKLYLQQKLMRVQEEIARARLEITDRVLRTKGEIPRGLRARESRIISWLKKL